MSVITNNPVTTTGVTITTGSTYLALSKVLKKGGKDNAGAAAGTAVLAVGIFAGRKLAKNIDPDMKKYALAGGIAGVVGGCIGLAYLTTTGKIPPMNFAAYSLLAFNGVSMGVVLASLPVK